MDTTMQNASGRALSADRLYPLTERIPFVDILRGMALLGILVENMAIYAGYSYEPGSTTGLVGWTIAFMVRFLLEAKSYSLLALLFGWGVIAMALRRLWRSAWPQNRAYGHMFRALLG